MSRILSLLFVLSMTAACTWVQLTAEGRGVRLAAMSEVGGCQRLGNTTATTRSRVAIADRGSEKVQDELVTLARNEAPGLSADTVQPKAEPDDGEQRFLAFRCRGAAPAAARAGTAATDGAAETYPIED